MFEIQKINKVDFDFIYFEKKVYNFWEVTSNNNKQSKSKNRQNKFHSIPLPLSLSYLLKTVSRVSLNN